MCAIDCRVRSMARARRRFARVAVRGAVLLTGALLSAGANAVPGGVDTLKVVIGASAGGTLDMTGRALGAAMIAAGEARSAIYDNRTGAAGTVALNHFAQAERGNPSALMADGAVLAGAAEAGRHPVALKDLTPIARLFCDTLMLVVPAQSSIRSMADLIGRLQSAPGAVSWAGGARGSIDHLLAGLIAAASSVDPARLNYVPFAGSGDVMAALLGNHVTVGVASVAELRPYVGNGKMRALAVSSASPAGPAGTLLAKIPPLKNQGVDVELYNWRGVYGAAGIGAAHRQMLVEAVRRAVAHTSWCDALQKNDWTPFLLTGEDFGVFADAEQQRLGKVLRQMGVGR